MSIKAAAFSLPASGHVNPMLPMVAELCRRGVEVDFYCGEKFRRGIEATGARFEVFPGMEALEAQDPGLGMFAFAEALARAAVELAPKVCEVVERTRADFVLHDSMTAWASLAAHKLGVPAVATYPSFATLPERTVLPPVPLLMLVHGPHRIPANLGRFLRRRALMSAALERFGVDKRAFPNLVSNPAACNVVFLSEEFQVHRERLDARFHFVGPCVAPRGDAGDFPLSELDGRQVVYASLGTVFHSDLGFYRTCLEAFGGRDLVLVMSVGANNNPTALGPLPKGVIVRRHVPQLEVLSRASLFVTHGGMNSVNEAMLAKVPMLVAPQGADQFLVARRVQELGLGRGLGPRFPDATRLRALGEKVMADASVRAQLGAIAETLTKGGGASRAAELALAQVAGAGQSPLGTYSSSSLSTRNVTATMG